MRLLTSAIRKQAMKARDMRRNVINGEVNTETQKKAIKAVAMVKRKACDGLYDWLEA